MASGETLFVLGSAGNSPPSDNQATPWSIQDASTPNIIIPVLSFDGATDEHMDWVLTVPSHFAGTSGFTFKYKYAMDGAQTALVEMLFRVLKLSDNDILTDDLGIDTQTAVAIQDTPIVTVTADKFATSPGGILSNAAMGFPSVGDEIILRSTRNTSAANNPDDLQLIKIYVIET